jgi:hypothetical protein
VGVGAAHAGAVSWRRVRGRRRQRVTRIAAVPLLRYCLNIGIT